MWKAAGMELMMACVGGKYGSYGSLNDVCGKQVRQVLM